MYPPIKPYKTEHLDVGDGHQLYLEQSGTPNGIPVLFVHGGPGGGSDAAHRQFFDPEEYNIILFDQRGCGKSTPHASLQHNTSAHLIEDIEKIRRHLNIKQWVLFGGSWGSTLSLLYAQAYPDAVMHLVLRGIFLCRQQDVDWFYQYGASEIFPDYWQDYEQVIPESERENMIDAYYRRLTGVDEVARMAAAKAWSIWEGRTSHLLPSRGTEKSFADPRRALAMARIECHYFQHQSFIEANQILDNMEVLAEIGGDIVHGRYDMVCPINQAYALSKAWPRALFSIVAGAGHSAFEPNITKALVGITDRIARSL